jgi:hypothetical protein
MAAPGQSTRNQIFDQIVLLLKQISVEAGDATSPVQVVRELLDIDAVTDFPVLCVLESPETMTNFFELDLYDNVVGVSVYGYVKKSEGRTRSQWLEDLWSDVVRKILGNDRLTNAAGVDLCMLIIANPSRESDGGVLEPMGAFVQDFGVRYVETIPAGA